MELQAPSLWQRIDFIADLHLQVSQFLSFTAWRDYLLHTNADAVFILGDLFEVWVGDDVLADPASFEHQCAETLFAAAQRMPVFIMPGNRDFLMGKALRQASSATLLEDPCVLTFGGQRWLLTHGDALCLDDTDYMSFRIMVRSQQWQQDFLLKPLPERVRMGQHLRAQSEARKYPGHRNTDLDAAAVVALLQATNALHMLHGHTHRPASHKLELGLERTVLSDWDLHAKPPRAEVLRLSLDVAGSPPVTIERLSPFSAVPTPRD